jgi:hypothetical protein
MPGIFLARTFPKAVLASFSLHFKTNFALNLSFREGLMGPRSDIERPLLGPNAISVCNTSRFRAGSMS